MSFQGVIQTSNQETIVLTRIMLGVVFLVEGIQKFLYPSLRGAGRFEKMGFTNAEFFGTFFGFFEVLAGILLLLGLFTRAGALVTLLTMTVAIIVTQIPMGFGEILVLLNYGS